MKRRSFAQAIMATALGHGLRRSTTASDSLSGAGLDRFGGWTGKKFQASGFFRVEKADRWWLVTPEGNAFLSFGINHLYPDLFKQSYNRESWQEKLGVDDLDDQRRFAPALKSWVLKTCGEYGFNTVGVHNALSIVNQPEPSLPYMQPIRFVDIPHWRPIVPDASFVDVFSQAFAERCDRLAKETAAPLKDDPFLLGYTMTDCPLLTEEDCRARTDVIGGARREARIGWPRRLRNLGADAPGKNAYVATMRDLYRDEISDFNAAYRTQFASFEALASAENWRPDTDLSNGYETRDNVEFLKRVVTKYYQTACDSIRRYDSNHLFIGDKINANTDTMDTILPTTSQFTDVVLYQMYARYEVQKPGLDRWCKLVDKPFINGDSAFTMITDTMPRPYGPVADNLHQRVEWTVEFFQRAFARPEFVGWHYCGLIDAPNLIARKQARQHSGLLNGYGAPFPELERAVKACADRMYSTAIGRL